MTQVTGVHYRWKSVQQEATARRTKWLYHHATDMARQDFDLDPRDVLIPAALLALTMVIDLHLSHLAAEGGKRDGK